MEVPSDCFGMTGIVSMIFTSAVILAQPSYFKSQSSFNTYFLPRCYLQQMFFCISNMRFKSSIQYLSMILFIFITANNTFLQFYCCLSHLTAVADSRRGNRGDRPPLDLKATLQLRNKKQNFLIQKCSFHFTF